MPHQAPPKMPHAREARRLRALQGYDILDTPREGVFDDVVRIASLVCQAPIAVINLIDEHRQWFKAETGLGVREQPLDDSICAHAILEQDVLVIPDTMQDPRFRENPLVTGEPGLRFYAGALLKTPEGLPLGTVCVLDLQPRQLDDTQLEVLRRLARQVMTQLELRRMVHLTRVRNERLASLIAAAGHDAKTPLRSALYAMQKLMRSPIDAEQVKQGEAARISLLSIDRQLTQLAAVATSTAMVPGHGVIAPLQDAFDAIDATSRIEAERRQVALVIEPSPLAACGPPSLVEIVLGNLVSNAVKYTDAGGRVHVTTHDDGERICVTVADTGIGIAPDRVEALFAAFQQADPAMEGLGLGLWIVRQTAEALGAEVLVHSAPGVGSRFTVRFLPVVMD